MITRFPDALLALCLLFCLPACSDEDDGNTEPTPQPSVEPTVEPGVDEPEPEAEPGMQYGGELVFEGTARAQFFNRGESVRKSLSLRNAGGEDLQVTAIYANDITDAQAATIELPDLELPFILPAVSTTSTPIIYTPTSADEEFSGELVWEYSGTESTILPLLVEVP